MLYILSECEEVAGGKQMINALLGKRKSNDFYMLLELSINEGDYEFANDIHTAMNTAEFELEKITAKLDENITILKKLTPECDKTDYILAACSGALCGVMDIFLVGTPDNSKVGDITDKWFADRTMAFAKMCGWRDQSNDSLSSAIKYLEKKFKIPYDQRGAGDAASEIFDLTPKNHHFKSLGHNPTLLGLFFSVLDQFDNTSHFISDGESIGLQEADGNFELQGNDVSSKLFCAFVNWFGHLISDMSGSSSSKGRCMGIPSPFWSWTNSIIAIKRELNIPIEEFDNSINELAIEIYKQGYDERFQATQVIPVFVNELLVRMIYSVRRLINYFMTTQKKNRSFKLLWKLCEPFGNATIKRMLTVAHGTFCLIDAGDATVRGLITGNGILNVTEFVMRLNIVGVGRFIISLYGEVCREKKGYSIKEETIILMREKIIIDDYVNGLKYLAEIYDDQELFVFIKELKESDMYIKAFEKTILLAEKRTVPKNKILRNKEDIDSYFKGESLNESEKKD